MSVDVAIVGGGLQGCLCMLALAARRPDARVVLYERGPELGGNHTWCFHAGDTTASARAWLEPAIAHRWDGYHVAFAEHARNVDSPYAAITSASLADAVRAAIERLPGFRIELNSDGLAHANAAPPARPTRIIDARGPERYATPAHRVAYQVFVGLELELASPHGLVRPMLMDARVPQTEGFRFVYVLPFSPTRVLVEDTYYAEAPDLDRAVLERRCLDYAARMNLDRPAIVRREHGVLPLPLDAVEVTTAAAGYQGGWFHPTTGYSFPIALRVAEAIAADADLEALATEHRRQLAFALRLNRMLFDWFAPDRRHHVLARFYRLPADTIARFYALTTTRLDRARIVVGRPPRGLSWRALFTGRKTWESARAEVLQ